MKTNQVITLVFGNTAYGNKRYQFKVTICGDCLKLIYSRVFDLLYLHIFDYKKGTYNQNKSTRKVLRIFIGLGDKNSSPLKM